MTAPGTGERPVVPLVTEREWAAGAQAVEAGSGEAPAVQARLRQARARLMEGRGPGAEPGELYAHQRDRATLGARPAAAERQHVADQAVLARRNPDELVHLIARRRQHLAHDVSGLAQQLTRRLRYDLVLLGTGAALGMAATAATSIAARRLRHRIGLGP